MKKTIKVLLIIWPIVCICYLLALNYFDNRKLNLELGQPDGVVWGYGADQIRLEVTSRQEGEIIFYTLRFKDADGSILQTKKFSIDYDLFGTGLVKTVQSDADSEVEILVWSNRDETQAYVLDYQDGQIVTIPYSTVSDELGPLTDRHRMVSIGRPMLIFAFVPLFLLYYLVLGIMWFIVSRIKRHRARKEADTAT
ncbi:MAG: hypothetical protein D6B25_17760 [Desulfobulbaceae bacterium]|nr:MAG: hypothetical protein D6B25_17760 [Desulfobulbaceae bacterium]